MKNKVFLLALVLLCEISQSTALNFPDKFLKVDQTYGDFNDFAYHDGIDLPGPDIVAVKSPISSGTVVFFNPRPTDGYVCAKDLSTSKIWVFGHIQPNASLGINDFINEDTILGELQRFPGNVNKPAYKHLHVALTVHENDDCSYTGAEDPLQYFPLVTTQELSLTPDNIMFTHNDEPADDAVLLETKFGNSIDGTKIIYGDTDIIVLGRNNVNGGNKSGVYRIDYEIKNEFGLEPVSERTAFVMVGTMTPADTYAMLTYLSPPSTDYYGLRDWDNYYNITNSGKAYDAAVRMHSNTQLHSWQTRIAEYNGVDLSDYDNLQNCPTGQTTCSRYNNTYTDNDLLALVNHNPDGSTAYTPKFTDGLYNVIVTAYSYPLENTPSVSTTASRNVIIDNFRPYLEQLEITNSTGVAVYLRQWSFDGSSLTASGAGNITLGADAYTARFRFSEPVADVMLSIGTSTPVQVTANPSGDKQNFTVEIPAAILSSLIDGEHLLTVQARDLAGNYILSVSPDRKAIVPSSELTRDPTGHMQGNEGGDLGDVSALTVDRTSPLITVLDNNGIVAEGGVSDGADGIWIAVDDFGPDYEPLYGSGPALLEIYRGDPAAGGVLLSSNTQSFDGGYLYTSADTGLPELAGLPEDLITAKACDRAGNCSAAAFIIQRPPRADLTAGGNFLYLDAWGVMTSTPSTLKRDFLLSSSDGNSGIASIRVTGPGVGMPDYAFSPAMASTGTFFSLTTPGDYLISIVDGRGARTELPFNFSKISVHVSTPESAGNVHYSPDYSVPGTADATLKLNLHAANGLERAEFLDAAGNLLRTEPLDGTDAAVVLATGPLKFNWVRPGAGISRITARVYDKRKNLLTETLDIGFGNGSFNQSVPGFYSGTAQSQVIDLAESAGLLSGGLAANYYIDFDTGGVLAALVDRSLTAVATLVPSGPPDGGSIPTTEIAEVTVKLRTGNSPDLSDASEIVLTSGKLSLMDWEPYVSYYETPVRSPSRIALQRYGQLKVDLTRIPHAGRISRLEDGQYKYYDVSLISIGRNIHYSALTFPQRLQEYEVALSSSDTPVYFGENVAVQFSRVDTPGARVRFTVGGYSPPLGSISIPQNTAYNLQSSDFTGLARIIFKVDTSGLTQAQAAVLKIVRIDDVPWHYTELPTTSSGGTVYADVTSLGRFMVTAPVYTMPHTTVSAETINGKPRLELTSNSTLVTYEKISADSIFSGQLESLLKSRNQLAAGEIYYLGPENIAFDPAATIKMRYDKALLESGGLWPVIYEISAEGGYTSRIPSMNWNQSTGEITALVPRLHSLFGVIVSSQFPPKEDTVAPVTTFGYYNAPGFIAAGKLYVSTVAMLALSAFDPSSNSAPKATYHFKDALPDFNCRKTSKDITKPEGSCQNPSYRLAFSFGEGRHTVSYFSVDNAGNYESVKSTIVYVDATPPVSEMHIGTSTVPDGGSVYITEADSITISAFDPEISLAASGVKKIYHLVDVTPEDCESEAPPAACATAEYTVPFSLSAGLHTVYYGAVDNVGNAAAVKSVFVDVRIPGDMMPSGYIRRIAGTGEYGYSGDGGDALNAKFGSSAGIVFDKSGNLLIADSAFNVVRKITPDGKVFTIAGTGVSGFSGDGGPATTARLSGPKDVAVDSLGNIYIADMWNNRVRKITAATGNISTILENLFYPNSLGVDKADNLYFYDYSRKVYKILPNGQKQVVAGTGVSGYSGDNGLAVNAQITAADGLAFDVENNLYIADTYNKRIRKVDANGIITTVAGGGTLTADGVPALQKNLSSVLDVEIDRDGNIFVVNGYTLYRIAKETGLVGTVSGDGYLNVSATPMPAAFASISYSPRFSLDGAGGVYLLGNGVVNKVALPGIAGSSDGSMKLYSSGKGISVSTLSADSPEAAAFFSAAGSKGLLPAGAVYSVSPSGAALVPPGSVSFRYNPQVVVDTNTLAVFTYDGVSLSSSPAMSGLRGQRTLPAIPYYNAGNLVAAEVQRIPGIVGLLIQVLDKIPPRSELAVGTPAFGAAPVYVSSGTAFTLTSSDDLYVTGDIKGFGVSRSIVRIKKGGELQREIYFSNPTPAPGQVFVSTFSLGQENTGIYTVEYYSADVSGNAGSVKVKAVTLDSETPSTELTLEGPVEPAGEGFKSLGGYSVRIVSTDSASGVANIKYLVDISTEACDWASPVVSTEPAGTCRNPVYAGPFTLTIGTHTVYYSAEDNVGNQAPVKNVFINVERSKYQDAAQWPYFEYLGGFGAYGTGPGYFKNLRGLKFDPGGNIWAADNTNSKIEIFAPGGEYLRTFTAGLIGVDDFSVCPDGTFWALSQITNGYYPTLKKFSADGALVKEIDVLGSQQFSVFPRFVVCDRENKPFVVGSTSSGGDVVSFDASGNYKGKFPINIPYGNYQGLASDANGDVLILDGSAYPNWKIKKFSQSGSLLESMPLISSSASSISLDAYGNIYIPNSSYSSVYIYTSTGGLLGTFGDLPTGRQMIPIGQPLYAGVSPYSGRLYISGTSDIKIYGPDHTPPQYVPSIFSPAGGTVVYTTSPFIVGSADAVSQIAAYEGATPLGKTRTDQYGEFSFNRAGLGIGRHLLRFQSSDAAGNTSPLSTELDITVKVMNSVEFSTPVWGPASVEMMGYGVSDTSATTLGDFDRDGLIDVVGFSRYGRYSFYKGIGGGTFKIIYTVQIPGMDSQYSGGDDALSADFNNDGFLDVAASIYSPNYPYSGSSLVLLYGNGDGTFQTPVILDHLLGYAGLAKGDFNKDGYMDLASASDNRIKIYLGDPSSLFISISTPIPAELPPSAGGGIAMSDIDGDGKADIVFRNAVLFGNGSGEFDFKVVLPYDPYYNADVHKVLISDFNRDGRKDIAIVTTGEALSFLNLGNRVFKKVHKLRSSSAAPFYSGASADFNGDGITDIAISPYRLQNIYIMPGYGDGTFAPATALPTGGYAEYGHLSGTILAEDVNGDGRNDIFQASSVLGLAGGQGISTFFSFLNKTAAPDIVPPAVVSLSAENTEAGEAAVFWTAPGNDGNTGRAIRYDLRYRTTLISSDIDFNAAQSVSDIASPRTSGSAERFTLSTLAGGTSYYFALKTYDDAGNASALSNSPGIFTKYIVKTTNTIDGNPEIGMVSAIQPYITQISTVSGVGAVAIGSAAAQSLVMAGNMYELGPEGIYEPPATLTFYYSTAALAGIGLTEADAAVYEYFTGTGWVKLEGQVLDTLNHRITVPITRIASLFGIFGMVKDRTAPLSEFLVAGSSWTMAGAGLYVNTGSSINLSASDPIVYGTSSGVSFTEFRVDTGTTAPFALYSGEFALSTGAHKLEFRSRDNAGNIEAVKTAAIFVDGEAPSAWHTVAGSSFAAGNMLYAASGSTITITSSDTASGLKELLYGVNGSTYSASTGLAEIYLSSGGAYTVAYHAVDNVGNTLGENVVLVYVDTATPTSALSLAGSPGKGGWYLSAADARMSASDDSSGIRDILYSMDGSSFTSYVSSFSVLSEGTHTIKVYSLDNVLNTEGIHSSAFGIDISTPLAGYSYLPASNSYGWNNTSVDVVFSGTDSVSGIEYCSSSFTLAGEGMGIPVSGYCADYAGWTSTVSFSVNIDTTAPASNAEIAAESGLNGWLLSPAGIILTSTDSLSGVAGVYYAVDGSSFTLYSLSFAVNAEGAHLLKYYALDKAGNKEAERELAFKLDLNSPIVSAVPGPAANTYGWNNTAVAVVFSGTDTISGLAYCEPEKMVETEGSSWTVTGYCSDYAGRSSTVSLTVSVDTTAPNLSYTPEPLANQLGWNNSDVLLKFTCADGLSGVKTCPADILLAGEGVNISTSAAAFDLAGNTRYTTAALKIDRTPPVITISSPAAGRVFIATRGDIGVKFGVTDNLDPAPASGAWLEQVEDRGSPRGARPARLAVANGQSIEPLDIDDGSWRLIVSATDFADNAAQLTGGAFEIIHDVLAPRTGQAITAGPSLTVGATTYITSAARLELTSIDDMVSANDGIGLGVKDQSIRVKSGGSLVKELLFANPSPKQGEAFISTVTGAGLGVADGIYGLAYNASDVLGNIETEKSVLIGLDDTAPASSAGLAGTAGGNGWHISTVTINLTATDALSGVAGISYGLDSGAYLAYTSPVETATEGQRTVRFYARDRLGNTEAGKSVDFKIDRTPPVVIATITPSANAAGWHSGTVNAGFSGSDAVSGIAYCEPAGAMRAEGRGLELSGYCRDQAGLTSTATARFNIDLTSPTVVVERAPLANIRGWNNTDVKVAFTCADSLSGIKSCPSAVTLAGEDAGQGASGTAVDNADNIASASIGGINIDKTAPAASLSVTGELWESGSDKYLGLRSNISLAAADGLSGVEAIEYRVDEAPFGIYSSSFSLMEGIRTIHYRAIDKADNVEAARTALYRVDGTPPVTTHHIGSPYHAAGGVDYITPATPITFTAEDPVSGGVHAGVSRIEVSLDGSAFSAYTAALKFSEGRHTIKYRAIDNVGNTEVVKSTVIYVDGTKPISELSISGDQYKSERQYISRRTDIVIAATDPVVNDVSVGVKETKYAVDGAAFSDYSQFKLDAEGRRLVSFYSADHVNNVEARKTAELWIDGTAPLSVLEVSGGKQYPGAEPDNFYASLATKFGLTAIDPVISDGAAGVKAIEYADNGGISAVYAQPISLGEGKHLITYRAIDRVENTEVFRSTQIYIDNTAPLTSFDIAEPLYIQDGVRYITPVSALTFSAIDPLTKEVAAGVERIETAVDGGQWLKYTQALKFMEGRHTIKYRAIDNVGNTEAEKTLELRSDNTPPVSKWRVNSGDSAKLGGRFYLNTQGKITLESADPVVAEVTSGLEGIYYGINAAPDGKYSAPLGLAEGIRTVNFSSRDNVGNTEVAKSTVIYVDGTGPVSGLTLTGDQYHGDKVHISTRTGIMITSVDPIVNEVASGLKETKYSVDGGLFVNYSLFRLSAEGKRLVSYYSADYVANTETVKTAALWVDNTPPSTELTVAGARYTAPGDEKLYITGDSGIVLTSWDSISNDTASGLLLTKYRIDGGNWQVYSGSFTVAAEGPHTLEYYALDRVLNAEPLKTIYLAVDNTPPAAAISLGEPEAEAFGLPLLTPLTRITLSAADPVVNGAASGLNSIFYEIKNMQTGALTPVTAYLSPFTMPGQGTFSIRYWSKDNTGNIEAPKEQMAAVTTWLEDGLAAVSGLEMSGTADISGSVKSNAIVSLSGNARILGDVTASTITLTGKAQITGLQVLRSPSIDPAPIILDGIIQSAQAANKNDRVAGYLAAGKLVLGSKAGIILSTGTYYFKGMELSGGSSITIAGKVDIVVEGGISINGGSSVNASGAASSLTIIVSTSSELKFSGGAALAASVYAPYSELKLAGNALLGGHYFVERAVLSGAGNILQAGEALPVAAVSPGGGPKTKAAAMSSGSFGILAGPDPAFRLGEVYVFPNPAKGGEAPVFHIETGIADTVKINIYTISGRAAHEQTLTGMPAELDDGSGLSYAYEYVWRGHIPSGVYLYYIETQKAGQKLKKTGKFSVVR